MKKLFCIWFCCVVMLIVLMAGQVVRAEDIAIGNATFDDHPISGNWTADIAPWIALNDDGGTYAAWVSENYYAGEPPTVPAIYCTEDNVYQVLNTNFVAGTSYTFSIDVGTRSGQSALAWKIYIFDADAGSYQSPLAVLQSSDSGQSPITDNGVWHRKSLTYLADTAVAGHKIAIGFTGDYYTMFDNAKLTAVSGDNPLMASWKFQQQYINGNVVDDVSENNHTGTITGTVNIDVNPESLVLDGTSNYVTVADAPLPTRDITLEAWVEVTQPVNWAGIVNYIQDNSTVEHGWFLGQNNGAFVFGISNGSFKYLSANQGFIVGQWYHVAATYDGTQMVIYINGVEAGTIQQTGNISYQTSEFRIGSYKDDNEQYLWNGKIAQVSVYNQALSSSVIQSHFNQRKLDFGYVDNAEVSAGPYVHFNHNDTVTIYYHTNAPVASVIEYGTSTSLGQTVKNNAETTEHKLTIKVNPETQYYYRVVLQGKTGTTYKFYTAFDFRSQKISANDNPYPHDALTDAYASAAEYILSTSNIRQGICIDYGCGNGRLAFELAKRSDLQIIGFDDDAGQIAAGRELLDKAGIYGKRITLLKVDNLTAVKCRNYTANLVVSARMIAQGICVGSAQEVSRILRPHGGTAILGQPGSAHTLDRGALESWLGSVSYTIDDTQGLWVKIVRGSLAGEGQWTHFYANLANTANSYDSRVNTSMKLQWYGTPGPRFIMDRHNRPMSSLYKNGMVITPGANRIMAYDAYNGYRYWDVEIPEAARAAILRDCGWMALADDYVYVAHKKDGVGLNINNGKPELIFEVPQLVSGSTRYWGYIAVDGDNLYGTGEKPGASLLWRGDTYVNQCYYNDRPIATSDYIFCKDRHTGTTKWTYKRTGGSVIINPAIVVAGDYIYFIESRNANAISDADGRITASVMFSGDSEYLVKLNKNTGQEVSAVLLDLPFHHVVYLSYAQDDDLLIAAGSENIPGLQYTYKAYRTSDLSMAWSSDYYIGNSGSAHGEQDQHPVIIGHTLYTKKCKVALNNNGAISSFPLGGGCGTQSASASYIFARNGNPYMYDLPNCSGTKVTNETRPGCWINMMAVGGMLMIPEASSGCTCDFPLQMTLAFTPDE